VWQGDYGGLPSEEFGCEVFGIDYGDQSVAAARSLAQSEHIDARVQFERGDAETLPFPDGSFDAVICECAFCTFPNKAASAREFFRVLRREGTWASAISPEKQYSRRN